MKDMIRKDEEIEISDLDAGTPDVPEEAARTAEESEKTEEITDSVEATETVDTKEDTSKVDSVEDSEEVQEDSDAVEEVSVETEDDVAEAEPVKDSEEEVVEAPAEEEAAEAVEEADKTEEATEAVDAEEDEDEEPKIDIDRANWYAIRTFSGQERKIMDSLISIIAREGFEDRIFEVIVPTQNVIEMRDGKKRSRTKVYFPGYVLVQMHHDKETQYVVENTYGVLNFIGPGNKPQSLHKREIKRILGEVDEQSKAKSIEAPFKVDDAVKVVDGPFNDFRGFVQEVNEEKQKVKVMVSIFGRATPVELDFLQVEIEK